MKRSREVEPLQWEDFVSEGYAQQLQKFAAGPAPSPEIAHNWHFQYVVSWLYNVCESIYTTDQGKPMFSQISFDEQLLLQDLHSENEDDNLYLQVRQHILQIITQNKQAQLTEWDVAIKYNLGERGAVLWYSDQPKLRFRDLSLEQQFEVLFACVKCIERKSPAFRTYLGAHLELFQFPECVLDERVSLLVLPGGKIVQKSWDTPSDAALRVPLKFRNCSIRSENEGRVEVFHLDFGPEIDEYLAHFSLQFEVLAATWDEFLQYLNDTRDEGVQEFLAAQLEITAANEANGRRLLHNRERERSMAELLVRRKRSSRLVAREEETQRRDLEAQWLEKLDERDHFLRSRQRVVAKNTRALKDLLWSVLWERFESDVKVEKLRRRTLDGTTTDTPEGSPTPSGAPVPESNDPLTAVDHAVLAAGEKFQLPLITVPAALPSPLQIDALELPDELLITVEDLSALANHGIAVSDYTPDLTTWYFQCPCNIEAGPGPELADPGLVNSRPLVCCDACLRWQHLDCQNEELITLLSQSRQKPITIRDLATATLGSSPQHRQRRSTRRPASEETTPELDLPERPTTKKTASSSNPESFMCSWCVQALEIDLRAAFPNDLTQLRSKQLKQHLDRERRKKQKEERSRETEHSETAQLPRFPHQITLPSQL